MPDQTEAVTRGAVYEWDRVRCVVNRVDRDGEWADFTMTGGGSSWGRRMALPLPGTFVRVK